ncbi:unnamed protein product [Amoebophrya sp. A25]|nr:unnamed protein product [Amoebophrya sp. A25]|eukprot:GSA25T00005147001.1
MRYTDVGSSPLVGESANNGQIGQADIGEHRRERRESSENEAARKKSRGQLVQRMIRESFEETAFPLSDYDACHACWGNIAGPRPQNIRWLTHFNTGKQTETDTQETLHGGSSAGDCENEMWESKSPSLSPPLTFHAGNEATTGQEASQNEVQDMVSMVRVQIRKSAKNWRTLTGVVPENELVVFSNAGSPLLQHNDWEKVVHLRQRVQKRLPDIEEATKKVDDAAKGTLPSPTGMASNLNGEALSHLGEHQTETECSSVRDMSGGSSQRQLLFDMLAEEMSCTDLAPPIPVKVVEPGSSSPNMDTSGSTNVPVQSNTPAVCEQGADLEFPPLIDEHLRCHICVEELRGLPDLTMSQTICISDAEEGAVFWYFRQRDTAAGDDAEKDRSTSRWKPWQEFRVPWPMNV